MNRRFAALFTLGAFFILDPAPGLAIDAGVARIDVTPSEPIRLTGYGGRRTNSIGVEQKLWAKALAIGSDSQNRAVLITLDNCGVAESTYRELLSRLQRRSKLKGTSIVIACSHTHSGPCTTDWAPNIFSSDIAPEQQAVIDRYTRDLIEKLEQVALTALNDRRPGQLSWSQGSVGFARNRRVVVGNAARFGDNAAGPVDHALPVLKFEDASGKLLAIVANYACHCTTLGGEFNHICGDWAGYAQEAIERDNPGAVALITIGCGADANPFPRGTLAQTKQHGEDLAAEVKRLLGQTFTPLAVPPTKLSFSTKGIELPFDPYFTLEQWQRRATNSGIVGYHARKWIARLGLDKPRPPNAKPFAGQPTPLPYPITTWTFGDQLAMVFLPGEVVVDYALRLKKEFDSERLWVTAYANYVPCYIPSRRILAEGGYEAEDSLWYYDRPARISTNAEELIIKTVHELLPKQFKADPKKAEFPDPKTPQQALSTIRTKAGFTVELVASEPLIESPVAIEWDARGRLWVCEMYDYPTGLKPPPEQARKWGEPIKEPPGGFTPGGRIKILTDRNGDGRYEKATLFLDKLAFPTGVFPWRNGALICAAPDILFAEDTDGDGRADVVRTNYTGFATHNYQARVNGFRWGLDGWLHGSSGLFGGKIKSLLTGKELDLGGRDFRIRPDTGEIEPLAGISQMGRVRDDFDNWFGNDNSTLLWHYPLPEHYMRRNPYVTYPEPRVNVASQGVRERGSGRVGTNASSHSPAPSLPRSRPAASQPYDPNKLYPISRTLERFNHPESANRVTGACGPEIYRDVLLGAEYYGNAFICEPVHNLVTRLVLEPDGVTFAGRRADDEQRGEFLASTDNWFRPVQVRTGPDGALWVVDMYRFVIEHPRWIAPERLKTLAVRAGADMGRIYRVYSKGAKLRPIENLTKSGDIPLAQSLGTPNGTARDLAHQELVRRSAEHPPKDLWRSSLVNHLSEIATTSPFPASRVQALAASGTLIPWGEALSRSLRVTVTNAHPGVRSRAAQVIVGSELLPFLEAQLTNLVSDLDPVVRFHLILALGDLRFSDESSLLGQLAATDDRWLRAAVLTAATNNPGTVFESLLERNPSMDGEFAGQLITTAAYAGGWRRMLDSITPFPAPTQPWHWVALGHLLDALERKQISAGSLATNSDAMTQQAGKRLQRCLDVARNLATDTAADEAVRESAIRLIRHDEKNRDAQVTTLVGLIQPGTPSRLQATAADTLRRLRGVRVAQMLLKDWNQNSPGFRTTVIGLLTSRDEWTAELLKAVEQGGVSASEIPPANRQRLTAHSNAALRERALKLFDIHHVSSRAAVLARFNEASSLTVAPDRGAALFDTHCAQCHAWRGHGHAVGPNLGEFAGKSVGDFVQAILDPNSALNPNFLAYNVETKDGRSLSGIVRGETASGLTLVQGGGVQETILRADIAEIRASNLSLMPEGLEQSMTPQDLADLIAWIKQAAPAPFGHASANPGLAAKNRAEFLKSGASGMTKVSSAAEPLPYRSWIGTLSMAFCRQSAGVNRVAWESKPTNPLTPALSPGGGEGGEKSGAAVGRTAAFRFPAAMGFLSQPSGKFTLRINGTAVLDFNVSLADETWQSPDGRARMSYSVTEANSEDSCGVLRIELASDLLKSGEPARFEVIGSDSGSQRWFGIYELNATR